MQIVLFCNAQIVLFSSVIFSQEVIQRRQLVKVNAYICLGSILAPHQALDRGTIVDPQGIQVLAPLRVEMIASKKLEVEIGEKPHEPG